MVSVKYKEIIVQLKTAILTSRYRAATIANKELLMLYFSVGKLISVKSKQEKWGAKVLDQISTDLQNELPGLRGFSATSLKKMRVFYESWQNLFEIGSLPTGQLHFIEVNPANVTSENKIALEKQLSPIGPLATDQFKASFF